MIRIKKIIYAGIIAIETFLPLAIMAQTDRYHIGVCDWMILKRQKIGEFTRAYEIGADGVELDMGGLGQASEFNNQLRDETQAKRFREVSDSLGIKIGAVAMSGFFGQSLLKKHTYLDLALDAFKTVERLGANRVVFLPLGGAGDWNDKNDEKEIVRRLREIGNLAKEYGIIVGIEANMNANEYKKFLKKINSSNIKVFYKWQNATEQNLSIEKDIRILGANNIIAMHASNSDGVCLRNDSNINVPAIKKVLDEMKWNGWLFVERSRDTTMVRNVVANYSNNVHYLKSIFTALPIADVQLDSIDRDPRYVKTILERSKKVTDEFSQTYTPKGLNIRNIVANRYFELNDIYAERDSIKKTNKTLADAICNSKLYHSHFAFEANLKRYLDDSRIERVKDVMTYHVVKVTYEAQCDMIPTLKEEEKKQILIWLKEARELAIDAESSKKKHELFGKYKGRINNYLAKRGYDLQKEREEWYKRVKARGGTL